jgi:hypothetical protein
VKLVADRLALKSHPPIVNCGKGLAKRLREKEEVCRAFRSGKVSVGNRNTAARLRRAVQRGEWLEPTKSGVDYCRRQHGGADKTLKLRLGYRGLGHGNREIVPSQRRHYRILKNVIERSSAKEIEANEIREI